VLALLLVVGAGVWLYVEHERAHETPSYATRAVERGPIDEVVMSTGNLQPVLTVNVGSQISGQVLSVLVDFNSLVHQGQVLARIDPRNLQAQREQTEADLHSAQAAEQNAIANIANAQTLVQAADAGIAAAQASLGVAQANRGNAKAQVVQAQAALAKTDAQVTLARLTYQRNLELVRAHFAAPQDLDSAQAALLAAQADRANAAGQLEVARAGVLSAEANLRNAQATLATAVARRATAIAGLDSAAAQRSQAAAQTEKTLASLRQILINLGYLEIRSPVDGVVIARLIDPGQTVAASFQTPLLFQVATDLKKMQALATVDESDVSRVFVGQQVSFTVNAWPGEVFRGGRVVSIRNATQNIQNVITYPVLIDIRNDDLRLRPGMTTNLTMLFAHRDRAIRVPNSALRFRPPGSEPPAQVAGRAMVWLSTDEGLTPCVFRPGITDGIYTEVVDKALAPGDRVVTGLSSVAPQPTASAVLRAPR
jgi:HlyD family secretion protein